MADDYTRNEIEELRAQLAELKAERKAGERKQAEVDSEAAPTGESASEVSEANELIGGEGESLKPEETDLTSQFRELFDLIDEELKATNPLTVLVVFALGVLVGRLLPR
jgi:chromosome segregation ATPase